MNPRLPEEATEFGLAASKAFAALGAVDAARRADEDPAFRSKQVAGALDALGLEDLDPRADADALGVRGNLAPVGEDALQRQGLSSIQVADESLSHLPSLDAPSTEAPSPDAPSSTSSIS